MKVLHIAYGANGGGVGFVIYNYCSRIDRKKIKFDLIGDDYGFKHLLHDRFEEIGFNVRYVTGKGKSLYGNIRQVGRIIRDGDYDAVHCHFEEWSFLYLWIAKRLGVPVRICHGHMAYVAAASKKPHYRLFKYLINRLATCRIACSDDAGKYLYGKGGFTILNNAIDARRYAFSKDTRERMRRELGVEGRLVVGNVGRFSFQKNPLFTVEIFREIRERNPKALLLLVGTGELEERTVNRARELGLTDSVMFMGQRLDVPELMMAMDAFLLPSRFEGLGIVYIEAQATGMHTFASASVVPEAAKISELMHFIPLEKPASHWAEAVLAYASGDDRADMYDAVAKHGYDIRREAVKLEKLYLRQYESTGARNRPVTSGEGRL